LAVLIEFAVPEKQVRIMGMCESTKGYLVRAGEIIHLDMG